MIEALFSAVREDCDDLVPFLLSGDDSILTRLNDEGHNVLMVALAHNSVKCTKCVLACVLACGRVYACVCTRACTRACVRVCLA